MILRVFYILKTDRKTHERKHTGRLEWRYKSIPMQADFESTVTPEQAYERLYQQYGRPPEEATLNCPTTAPKQFAEMVSHKLITDEKFQRDKIEAEKRIEQPLFGGVAWFETHGERK